MKDLDPPERFNAMDRVRATAMLLGVFYHSLLFGGMMGGAPPGVGPRSPGGPLGFSGAMLMQDWLHSFRMPLFFLISGFFCRMMLKKYGLAGYLFRRWHRIALPLLIGIFTFVPLYHFAAESFRSAPAFGSPGGPRNRPLGPDGAPMVRGALRPPPPGVVPPFLARFDTDQDGTLDDEEWKLAQRELPPPGGPPGFGPPGFGPPGARAIPAMELDERASDGQVSPSDRPPFPQRGTGRGAPGPGGPPGMFSPPGAVSSWLFGSSVRYFTLSHLWFLWYLLVFATVAPLVAVGAEIVGSRLPRGFPGSNVDATRTSVAASPAPNSGGVVTDVSVDRSSGNGMAEWLIRWNVIPALVGLISLPCLLLTRPFFGWSLGLAAGIGRAFPDFLWHVELDMPFYFAFFLWGWWLHRKQDLLPSVGARWWSSLTIGLIAFLISWSFSRRFSMQSTLPHYALLRLTGYFCYAVGSAYLSWGFLGLFQRFANAPTRLGRYLADTAFWVYLLHQALLFPFLAWLAPFQLPWWLNGSLSSLMTIMAALLFYECLVRATPLVRLFGPGSAVRPNTLYSS